MLVPNNLYEVVWREEVEDQEKFIRDSLIGVTNIHVRLKEQRAPQELVERLFDLKSRLEKSLEDVRELRKCFPSNPNLPR